MLRMARRFCGWRAVVAVTIGVVAASRSAPARGASVVWGGGSGVWSTPANWVTGAAPTTGDVATFSGWAPLSRTGWVASASATNGGDAVANAIDGLQSARWSTGANQAVGQWFKVDMGSTHTFSGISLDAGTNTTDYPLGFDVYVSNDDVTYGSAVASGAATSAFVSLAFTAHTARYVKIMLNQTGTFWWSISELDVFGSTGGTQLSRSSWSATASVTGGTNVAANGVDNSTATYWTTGANQIAPQWFKIDMGSSQTFTQINIDSANDPNDYPHGYAVYAYNVDDGQHDGSAVAAGVGTSALLTVTFSSQTARYIKIVQTGTSTQWWSLHEVNVLNGASVLSRAAWTVSGPLDTADVGNAIDGNASTRWTTMTGQAPPQWFKVDMQSTQTITQLRLDGGTQTGKSPATFAVYAYDTDDGLNDGNPIAVGTSSLDVTDISFSAQTARYVKVLITAAAARNWAITELTVYGTPVGSNLQSAATVAGVVLTNAVTVTQSAGATLTVNGSYTQSAGSFVGGASSVSVSGTFSLTGGTYDAGSSSSTVTGLATISGGTYKMGSSGVGQTLNGGLTIAGGTVLGSSATGLLALASGKTLSMSSGALQTSTATIAGPTISATSGTFTFSVTGGIVSVNGLKVSGTDAAGVNVSGGATISQLDDVDFAPTSNPASASYVLTIDVASLGLYSTGCKFNFDPGVYTNLKNVHLTGTGSVGAVRAHFQFRNTATNGLGAGDRYDGDEDTLPGTAPYYDDGVGDAGKQAVAYWDYAVADDTAGTAQGAPTAAFDWNSFTFYSVYSVFDDIGGAGTADRIYVRDTNGGAVSTYDIPNVDGNIVATPLWNTEGGQHVLYVATSTGMIFRLVDMAGTLALASSPWDSAFTNVSVSSITTGLVGDGVNVYFAGTNGATPSIFGVSVSGKALVKNVAAAATITATPNVGTSSGSTYLFVGSAAVASQAYIYRVDVSAGMNNATCTQATSGVNGSTRLSSGVLYAGDSAGKLHAIDAFNLNSGGFANLTNFPYHDTVSSAAITSAPYIDRGHGLVYFGDSKGYLHGVTTAGTQVAQLQVSATSTLSGPISVTSGDVLVGDSGGNVYYVNTSSSPYTVYYTVSLNGSVSAIAYDADSGQYMASTSSGHLVYLPATP
jgi:hypothetical protein